VPVTVVARRYGVARQKVHEWLARYANGGGLAGLVRYAWAHARKEATRALRSWAGGQHDVAGLDAFERDRG
jgi:hypothetical protein